MLTSPGRAFRPPPTRAAIDALWCGLRNGRARLIRPPSSVPATLATIDVSSASVGVSSGNMPGRQLAISDLPAPGGPTINLLWTKDPIAR